MTHKRPAVIDSGPLWRLPDQACSPNSHTRRERHRARKLIAWGNWPRPTPRYPTRAPDHPELPGSEAGRFSSTMNRFQEPSGLSVDGPPSLVSSAAVNGCPKLKVDLVDPEDCRPGVRQAIQQEGVALRSPPHRVAGRVRRENPALACATRHLPQQLRPLPSKDVLAPRQESSLPATRPATTRPTARRQGHAPGR